MLISVAISHGLAHKNILFYPMTEAKIAEKKGVPNCIPTLFYPGHKGMFQKPYIVGNVMRNVIIHSTKWTSVLSSMVDYY